MAGQLYMIGSPIGNLGDLSRRAIEVLASLDRLYCEDTRVTGKLVSALELKVSLKSLSDDSPAGHWASAIKYVLAGHQVGFITDAGMPGLSDPGRKLLQLAWAQGLVPTVIPGPSSVGSLLALCPFISNSFHFVGFAPRKSQEIDTFVAHILSASEPTFFFESPRRIHQLLAVLCAQAQPSRLIMVGRELTKLHEQVVLFQAGEWPEVCGTILAKGEFTLALQGQQNSPKTGVDGLITAALSRLNQAGFSARDSAKAVAACLEISPNDVKKAAYPK